MRVLKKRCFKRDHEKGKLIFSFASSPFLWAKLRKTKGPGTSYQSFRVAKHAQEKFLFWSGFLNLEIGKKRRKRQNIEYLIYGKSFVEEFKTIFYSAFFW